MRRAARVSTTRAAGLLSRTVNSLKKVRLTMSTPRTAPSFCASWTAWAWLSCASLRKPASPSNDKCTVKASAHRPELVQMFEVAFSRLMCCSRVDNVRTQPRLPSTSVVSPTSRPGIWRT